MASIAEEEKRFPDRKISETFIDFAAPFVAMIDENTTQSQVEQGFKIAFTVWNAVVIDTVNNNDHFVSTLHGLISSEPEGRALIDQLIARKRERFADDLRLIGNCRLTYDKGDLHVWAEARRSPRTT